MLKKEISKLIGFVFRPTVLPIVVLTGWAVVAISGQGENSGLIAHSVESGAAFNTDVKFSSVYTDTTKQCKGEEPMFTCTGYGGYRLVMGVGGVFANARVESAKTGFTVSIAERQSVAWNPVVEWRMADGVPFAVIVRADENDPDADIPKKTGEKLLITGLKGYEHIAESVDAKTPRANEKAREIADQGYAGGTKSTPAAQTDAYTDGRAALLSAGNIKSLTALKAAIAVPTYLPAGYKLKKIEIQAPEAHIIAFSMVYENAAGKSFTIESNNEALGDMAVKREIKGMSNIFKDSAQESGKFYTGHDKNDAKTVASEWLCSVEKYQPKGSIAQCFQFLSESKSLSPAEAMKIMSSLRYLKR